MSTANVDSEIVGDNSAVQADEVIKFVDKHTVTVAGTLENPYLGFTTHPVLLSSFTWDGATATDVNVASDLYSSYIALAPSAIRKKFSNFGLQTAKFKIAVIVQGSTQSSGQLIVVAAPRTPTTAPSGTPSANGDRSNIYNSFLHPHVVVDPSKSATYEFEVGMSSDTGVMNTSWVLDRHVVNPIRSGTATASTVTVSIYCSLSDVKLDAPTTNVILTSSKFQAEKEVAKPSTVLTNVSRLSALAGSLFPVISPYTTLFSRVSGATGDYLHALGYAKPPVVGRNVDLVVGVADPPSQVEGNSSAVVFGRSQGDSRSIDPVTLGGSLEEQKISTLIARPSLAVRDLVVLPAAAAGSLVASIPVTPALSHFAGTVTGLTYPTPLAMFNLLHLYYTGSLDYRFEFVASIFHRATFVIAYETQSTPFAPPSMADAMATLPHVVINVSGNTAIDVHFPYKNIDPWTLTSSRILNYDLPNVTSTSGWAYIYLMQPVRSSGSTDGIGINIFTSSKDMVFAMPTLRPFSGSYPYKVALTGSKFIVESDYHSMGENRIDPKEAVSYMTDVSMVLKDLTRRSNSYAGISASTYGLDLQVILQAMPAFPGTSAYSIAVNPTFGALVATGFKGFLGSAEYIFRAVNTTNGSYQGFLEPSRSYDLAPNAVNTSEYSGNVFYTNGDTSAISWNYDSSRLTSYAKISVPFLSNRYFYYTLSKWINTRDSIRITINAGDVVSRCIIYAAHGDDATYVQFLGFPTLYTNLPNP